MTKQPEALRLAKELDAYHTAAHHKQAAAELRRLHAANQALAEQPEQEPVAIVHRNEYNEYRLEPHDNFDIKSIPFNIDVPLFKSPQRTWVGLTDEDKRQIFEREDYQGWLDYINAIEAKLKEKNNGT